MLETAPLRPAGTKGTTVVPLTVSDCWSGLSSEWSSSSSVGPAASTCGGGGNMVRSSVSDALTVCSEERMASASSSRHCRMACHMTHTRGVSQSTAAPQAAKARREDVVTHHADTIIMPTGAADKSKWAKCHGAGAGGRGGGGRRGSLGTDLAAIGPDLPLCLPGPLLELEPDSLSQPLHPLSKDHGLGLESDLHD